MEPSDLIENRTFDEIAIGDSASLSRTLSKDDISLFAVMSGDVNPAIIGGCSCPDSSRAPPSGPKSDRGRVMVMEDLIPIVNSGSSSIKFSAYNATDGQDPALLFKGQVEGIGSPHQSLTCIKAQSAFADSFSAAHSRPTFAHLAPS